MAKGILWNGSDHQAQLNLFKDAGGTYTFFDYNSGAPIAKVDKLQADTIVNEAGNDTPSATYGVSFPAGQGLDFSASAGSGAASSIFDDYEEGTFTLIIADAVSGGNLATFTQVAAEYTKKGDEVFVNFETTGITTAGMTGGNTIYFRGLPYSTVNDSNGTARLNNVAFSGYCTAIVELSRIEILEIKTGVVQSLITVGDLTSGTAAVSVTISYKI